jgi:hypothetical protein
MAVSIDPTIVSMVAGATFSSGDMYKFVVTDSSGHAVLPSSTGNVLPDGVLYGRTSTTSAAGSQAVPVAIGGIVKVRMAASTLDAGDFVASSTAGMGIAPTTDSYTAGRIVRGSSGGVNRVVSVNFFKTGPLSTP